MAGSIYDILNSLGQEGILGVVLIAILFFALLGLVSAEFSRIAPTLMTSLGIFGTFCGIFLALYPLDTSPENINTSIDMLIQGMKTAFVTSLIGLFSAILYRSVIGPIADNLRSLAVEPVSREERAILERLDAIRQAISGDGDSSIVTQIRALRDESREGFSKLDGLSEAIRISLVENLQHLMEHIREIIGEQLKHQLEQLAAEIREVMIERLGSTFTDLKDATVALNEWQQHYRAQVEQLTNAFNLAAERITSIALDCEKIPPTMEQLREVIGTAHQDIESLNNQVEAFAGMRQQAEESFPVIKEYLDKIGKDLSDSADGFKGLEETIQASFKSAGQESNRLVQQHTENVENLVSNMREKLENAQQESSEKITEVVEAGLQKFDEELNREVNELTRAWGENMVAIARECAETINAVKRDAQ